MDFRKNPWIVFVISFVALIILGSILLSLPPFHNGALSYIDALFTSTSAMCVTGLVVKDTGKDFTTLGQIVILFLIQAGGLGIMTFTVAVTLIFGRRLGGGAKEVIGEQFRGEFGNVRDIIKLVLIYTFVVEGLGAMIFYPILKSRVIGSALFNSIFHSISAFCNAGFSLFTTSFEAFSRNPFFLLNAGFLIFAGGIGFLNGIEIIRKIGRWRRYRLSLNAKLAFSVSVGLILVGTVFIFLSEISRETNAPHILLLNSFFQSITARTAGFNSVRISNLTGGSLFVLWILMMIGATSGSCGGGMKTTTVGVVFAYIKSQLKGFRETVIFNRAIREEIVSKALSVFFFYLAVMSLGALLICLTNYSNLLSKGVEAPTFPILFETVSALSTVGLSFGITPLLNTTGKIVLIFLMLAGRIGLITLIFGILMREKEQVPYTYPEERVMIG